MFAPRVGRKQGRVGWTLGDAVVEHQGAEDENTERDDLDEQARFDDFQGVLHRVGIRRCDLAATYNVFVTIGFGSAGVWSYQSLVQGEKERRPSRIYQSTTSA